MRVIFVGTAAFAIPSLKRLAASRHTVALCVTQPDRPQGRGLSLSPSPVKCAAQEYGLPLSQPERLRADLFASVHPDVGVVAAYGQLIRKDLLALPPHGMLGVHPSLLPTYRGAAPVAWALLNGETATGITIFRLSERLDAGEIASQRTVAIEPGEDAEGLTMRLAHEGADELLRVLEAMDAGRATWRAQDESQATLAPKLTKAQGRIDWSQDAEVIARVVRATVPWPGATTAWKGAALKIWNASVSDAAATPQPAGAGTVVRVTADAVEVMAGRGVLALREVQPAGRRRMSAREFLAGHKLSVGDRLGTS